MDRNLNINEIFLSIQGESLMTGLPSLFIRLSGCNMRCRYCDTAYAFSRGKDMPISKILKKIPENPPFHVTITGGEPLMQAGTPILVREALKRGARVVLFTNGSLNIGILPAKTIKIMDIKSPWCETDPPEDYKGYQTTPYLDYANLKRLNPEDQIKFVIRNRTEFLWSKDFIENNNLNLPEGNIIFSPESSKMPPKQLGEWILDSKIPVRLGIQVHKFTNLDPEHDK